MKRALPLIVALLLATALSWPALFFFRDNFSTQYPIKVLSAASQRAFEIPYWNFADGGGQPLAGNPNTLTFYPDNILYLAFPPHVAFNLHFWIHLIGAFFAMRAVTRSWFGGLLWAMSGVAISATAFYNLTVAVVMVPLAFLAVQRRSAPLLGLAFGLLILGTEPVTILATAIAVAVLAFRRMSVGRLAVAVVIAVVIASPLLIAYGEIAGEVERAVPMSAKTVLTASLEPVRLLEFFIGPVRVFLNDPGVEHRQRLFSTIFLGVIAGAALFQKSRYVVIVAVLLFFALGRYNPLLAAMVESFPPLRILRFPEKFVLPAAAALTVLSAEWFRTARFRRAWIAITFLPLAYVAFRALPIDWFAPYDVPRMASRRVHAGSRIPAGVMPAREEYRARARALEPIFGAAAGLEYVVTPSPDGMHALRSRMIVERFRVVSPEIRQRYLQQRVGPPALLAERIAVAPDIYRQAAAIESPSFDPNTTIVPRSVPVAAGTAAATRRGQTLDIDVRADGRAILVVNQTYFRAWSARSGDTELETLPVNVDRLGVLVPAGTSHVTLRFGRRRPLVAFAWVLSLVTLAGALLVEKRDRRAGQVERSADEDRALA